MSRLLIPKTMNKEQGRGNALLLFGNSVEKGVFYPRRILNVLLSLRCPYYEVCKK